MYKFLKDKFNDDARGIKALVEYQEPFGGNMAIHFAVLKGNRRILDSIINDFKADPKSLTSNGLSILHCAA